MAYVPPPMRKRDAAIALLNNPPPYDPNPIFAAVPQQGWAAAGYQYTLTVQWSNVAVPGLPAITVRAHVHYAWDAGQQIWTQIAGNAWVSGLAGWSTPTTAAVVALVPAEPPNPAYHP